MPLKKVEDGSEEHILQSYLNGDALDPSLILSCSSLCRSLPFKTENKFVRPNRILKNNTNNTQINEKKNQDNQNENENQNQNQNQNQNRNYTNSEEYNNREQSEYDINFKSHLEKEYVIIIQIIDVAVDCLKFSFSHLHYLKKLNMKKHEKNISLRNNSLLLKNSASLVTNNNSQIINFSNDNNSISNNNFDNNDNNFAFDKKSKYTGSLPQALLISAGLGVLSSCALLLGRLYRNSLLKVTINNYDCIFYHHVSIIRFIIHLCQQSIISLSLLLF